MLPANAEAPVAALLDLELEDLLDLRVVTASRHEQLSSEAPSAVTIVTAEDIRAYGYRTLGDVLRGAVGFYTTYDRNYSYLGIRGFGLPGDYNTRVLLLIDGTRVNDNVYGLTPMGTDSVLDLDAIDRVEIVRGPGSALYGTNAFFAVINVITPQPEAVVGGTVGGSVGSAGTASGRFAYAHVHESAVQWQVSGFLEDSQGSDLYFSEFDDPATNHGMAQGLDDDRSRGFAGKLIYRNLSAQVILADREKAIPTASFGTVFGDPRTATTDARSLVAINLNGPLARGPSYRLHLSRGQYRYEGTYPYEYGDASSSNVVLTDDGCDGVWYTGEALVSIPSDPHRLTLGAEVRRSTRERQWNRHHQDFLDVDGQSTVWGTFAQAEAEVGSRLRFVGGLRYDRDPSFGGTTNPRLAAIVQAPGRVRAKLLYGTAFRAPSAYERMYFTAQGPLDPETISTRELNLERPLSRRIDVRLSAFDNRTRDLIQLQSNDDGDLLLVNAAAYDAEGVELELRGAWPGRLRGSVRYSYVQVEDEFAAEVPANSASHTGGVNLAVPIPASPLLIASELRYMGSRPAVDGSQVDGHLVADLILSARILHGRVGVTAGVRNLFDVEYADPGSEEHVQVAIGQDGRRLRVTADIRF